MELNKVYLGDCLEVMPTLPDKSIDMVLTSPPYDNLRTYNGSLDWGEHRGDKGISYASIITL